MKNLAASPFEKYNNKIHSRHFPVGGRLATLDACAMGLAGSGSPLLTPQRRYIYDSREATIPSSSTSKWGIATPSRGLGRRRTALDPDPHSQRGSDLGAYVSPVAIPGASPRKALKRCDVSCRSHGLSCPPPCQKAYCCWK